MLKSKLPALVSLLWQNSIIKTTRAWWFLLFPKIISLFLERGIVLKKLFSVSALALVLLSLINLAGDYAFAGELYLSDLDNYWYFIEEQPYFEVLVPSSAERYVQKNLFGAKILEMTFNNASIIMEVGVIKSKNIKVVQDSIEARFKPAFSNKSVIADRQITTSNDETAHFYAFRGTGLDSKTWMLRTVFFQKGDYVVYLAYIIDNSKYDGDYAAYWLQAVNSFGWLK